MTFVKFNSLTHAAAAAKTLKASGHSAKVAGVKVFTDAPASEIKKLQAVR